MVAVIAYGCFFATTGFCAAVPMGTARQVAQGVLQHHVALFGHWNGSPKPTLGDGTVVQCDAEPVAFNFQVRPSGHVLVIVDDDLNPVPLYSTTSAFVPGRADNPNAIESWIVPEMNGRVRAARDFQRRSGNFTTAATQSTGNRHPKQIWAYFRGLPDVTASGSSSRSLASTSGDIVRSAAVSPLLTTAWGQADPYNLKTPGDTGCAHTRTGCVATAWAQLLNYWKWPLQGQGSHSYDWIGVGGNETLSVNFGAAVYDWSNMTDVLAPGSTQAQKAAVSQLVYHLGVAAEMEYGCSTSGSWFWADEVLDTYFKYKGMTPAANRLERENYTASQWFARFRTELDADPPRPVIFSIGSDLGWHEVVVDGYQQGPPNMVHINFGWDGSYDGYYNVNDDNNFNTGGLDWYVNHDQLMVIGIAPDNPPPSVDAGGDQNVDEETRVQLSGIATDPDPDSTGITSYLWTQVSGPTVEITNAASTTATFTTPNVDSATQLIFQLRAEDANRAHGTDTVIITVNNTDGSVATPTVGPPAAVAPSGSGSSGISSGGISPAGESSGGCFIGSLFRQWTGRN